MASDGEKSGGEKLGGSNNGGITSDGETADGATSDRPDISADLKSRFSWLPRFAVTHPVTVAMALVGLLVLGGITYFKLPLE